MTNYSRPKTCDVCGKHIGGVGPSHKNCSIKRKKKYAGTNEKVKRSTRYTEKNINYFLK